MNILLAKTMKVEFWLGLLLSIIMGTTVVSETSSMTSDNVEPQREILIEWPCILPMDGETCWLVITDEEIKTGP